MSIVLTIDVEDWYHTSGFNFHRDTWHMYEERVVANTERILTMLDENQIKGTFFILGCVAEKHPDLVRSIHSHGHEIGCHGYYHQMIHHMDRAQAIEDILRAKQVLEEIVGEPVRYFRAPTWSIGKEEVWLLSELQKMGFVCDSSIQPFKTHLSGFSGAPSAPFVPIVAGCTVPILECPVTLANVALFKLPFSGGFYLRVLPYWMVKWLMKRSEQKGFTMIYWHPWEMDEALPKISTSFINHILHYVNVKGHEKKLRRLLREFEWVTLGSVVENNQFPKIRID